MELIRWDYKQTFYVVGLFPEDNITYYWYVIPHLQRNDGEITGICKSGVASFKLGIKDEIEIKEVSIFKIDFKPKSKSIDVARESKEVTFFTLYNLGNQNMTINIATTSDPIGDLIIDLPIKRIMLPKGTHQQIQIYVTAIKDANLQDYTINITATYDEDPNIKANADLYVNVIPKRAEPKEDTEDSYENLYKNILISLIILAIIIFNVIMSVLLFSKRKRKLPVVVDSILYQDKKLPISKPYKTVGKARKTSRKKEYITGLQIQQISKKENLK
jgi:hypothetical protein